MQQGVDGGSIKIHVSGYMMFWLQNNAWVPVLQAVTAIVHIGEARQLATLCDGALQLLDQESLEGKHVPGPKVDSSLAQGMWCSCGPALETQAGSADARPGCAAAPQAVQCRQVLTSVFCREDRQLHWQLPSLTHSSGCIAWLLGCLGRKGRACCSA